jgi:hypothetical protein
MPKAKEPAEPIKPTEYTPELGERLCERMLQPNGDKSVTSLRAACLQADLPDVDRVMRWLAKGRAEEAGEFADFVKLYDEAKRLQAEIGAAEVVEISDDVAATTEAVQRAKLRVSTRQWYAEKLLPKVYGNRQEITGSLTVSHEQALDALR